MVMLDLTSATPKEVADYILKHRFQNKASDAATFLLEVIDELGDVEEISRQLMQEGDGDGNDRQDEDAQASDSDSDSGIGTKIDLPLPIQGEGKTGMAENEGLLVSASTPRTKMTLTIHQHGMVLTSPKNEILTITPSAVKYVIFFPKHEDCVKAAKTTKDGANIIIPGSQVLIVLNTPNDESGSDQDGAASARPSSDIVFRKKKLNQICLALPQHHSDNIPSMDQPSQEQLKNACIDGFENKLVNLISSSLELKHGVFRILNPKYSNLATSSTRMNSGSKNYIFQSDDGGSGKSVVSGMMPYVKCYSGVNDGVLYPMEEGLLFFKPPSFLHRSKMSSIACGRGGGGSRYVDMAIVLDGEGDEPGKEIEFTNIDREELEGLNKYIHNTLVEAMKRDAAEQDSSDDGATKDDEDDDDEDKVLIKGNEDSSSKSRKRPSRAASIEARKATKFDLDRGPQSAQGRAHQNGDSDHEEDDDYDDDDDDEDDGAFVADSDDDEDDAGSCDDADSATESEGDD